MKKQITSLIMLIVFLVLCITGVLSYFTEYTRRIATVHTVFGFAFTLVAAVHLSNNIKPLKKYSKGLAILPIILLVGALVYSSISESLILKDIIDYGARSKARIGVKSESNLYSIMEMSLDKEVQLSFDLKRGEHFWHPQIAVWTEDSLGNYLETLFVTKATAKSIFEGDRTKDNFKSLDSNKDLSSAGYRRVNALPVWSHKRGIVYEDGLTVPTYDRPLPDGISGATPLDNFLLKASVNYSQRFVVKLEINVAFDDNEYYSAYDFPDDAVFHNGTGQLGQPSIVFSAVIDQTDDIIHNMMMMEGHGHHSGQNGLIHEDKEKLTTALEIVEYIVVSDKL